MKNVFISGIAGFLGNHLARYHLDRGDVVFGVDDYSTSKLKAKHNLELCANPNCTISIADITYMPIMNARLDDWHAAKGENFDVIYNLACPASPPRYQEMPVKTMMTCVLGTKNMLDIAKRYDCPIVQASTSEVYGNPDVSPQRESYKGIVNSYGPRSCYDEGKRAAEALCFDYLNGSTCVDARVVRIFNTYGPFMDPNDGRVVSNFICQALQGKPLTIYGDGTQTRSFCYASDLIKGIVAMGNLEANLGAPINIGNPKEFKVLELAMKINKIVNNSSSEIVSRSLPQDDPLQRKPDITKARAMLGFNPVVDLDEGLAKTIDYFKSVL